MLKFYRHKGRQAGLQLALSTISFAICFAAWGLISAFAPQFREQLRLSAKQAALLTSAPVLLGSLARIPMGVLADRFGGRAVFACLMLFSAIPAACVPPAASYRELLVAAFVLGMAGSSFAVGVALVSGWFEAQRQGAALGVYGVGNIGQSAAVFLGPTLAAWIGWRNVYYGVSALLVIWAAAFGWSARNATAAEGQPRAGLSAFAAAARERKAWALAAFYFLTFGGFVAFSIYLPSLLRDEFKLTAADAGFRAAGFVALATAARPVGGWLSDRIGGSRVLSLVFAGIIPFALLLSWPAMLPFTVGALGCAALLGLGNGAVFKLVAQHFPGRTGTVTGLVGAMGGLGGFFPPLVLGALRDAIGAVWPGFVLLAMCSAALWRANGALFQPPGEATEAAALITGRAADRLRAGMWATFWTGLLIAAIVVGSRNLENFDPALVIYTFAVIFATWGVTYHYNVWISKPPTRMYWDRGWQLFRRGGMLRNAAGLIRLAARNIAAQTFLLRRSRLRWWMHQCIFWGCILAVAITFPLVFGWISFQSALSDQMTYVIYLFGFPAGTVPVRSVAAEVMFHGLDIAAALVLIGVFLSLWRRMRDRGAQTVQSFAMDFFPIILLFAISITGLALTASQQWLGGALYSFLAVLHAITVIGGLLYLPFGKFFHIFQRPAQLGVKLYHKYGDRDEGALCARCGQRFASRMHLEDLKAVTVELGFDYALPRSGRHWLELCPACKRKTIAIAQLALKKEVDPFG
jgi:NNP family nitrate/nitrite transporter-like MFS transporter